MRLDGAGVPLEVALTAKLAHPNLLAARAHAIIRYAARAGSSGSETPPSRRSGSLDSRPPLAPDVAPPAARTALCTPAAPRWPSQGSGSGFSSGFEDAAGARTSSAGASASSGPVDGAQLGHAARQGAAPSCASHGGGGGGACSRESSLCGEQGSCGRSNGATPPRSARDWDSPGAWGSLPGLGSAGPGAAPAGAARPGGATGVAGAAGRGDGGGPAAQLLAGCGAGPGGGGGGGGPAQREEGEVWLLLDFCDRGCLAARARPARALPCLSPERRAAAARGRGAAAAGPLQMRLLVGRNLEIARGWCATSDVSGYLAFVPWRVAVTAQPRAAGRRLAALVLHVLAPMVCPCKVGVLCGAHA